ncbi:hypothetical protein ES703_12804 [subsurface metagenome]
MITEATVKNVRFPPELLPDSWVGNLVLGAEFAPPVLDLRRFKPYITELANIQVTANPLAELRARYDGLRVQENTAAMISALVGAWRLVAKDILYLNFFGVGGVIPYSTHYGVWAYPPTIAHRILYYGEWKNGKLILPPGILSDSEKAIAVKHNIFDAVEKGVLPLPISQQIEREYKVVAEETHARSINIAVINTVYTIESIYPRKDEVIILTRMAAAAGLVGDNVRFIVDRDDDTSYRDIPTFPMSLLAGGEVACFMPATREIRLTTQRAVGAGAHLFRYTYQRVKLTNTLRARFGLAGKEELPGDVWEKVMAGVL